VNQGELVQAVSCWQETHKKTHVTLASDLDIQ